MGAGCDLGTPLPEALFQGHTGDVGRQSQQSPAHLVGPHERQIWGRQLNTTWGPRSGGDGPKKGTARTTGEA